MVSNAFSVGWSMDELRINKTILRSVACIVDLGLEWEAWDMVFWKHWAMDYQQKKKKTAGYQVYSGFAKLKFKGALQKGCAPLRSGFPRSKLHADVAFSISLNKFWHFKIEVW